VAVWLDGNALVLINVVTLHRTQLVFGWVTPYEWVASHLSQLSLLPSVGQ